MRSLRVGIFANLVAAYYASSQHCLPVLFVIFNNATWDAVCRAMMKVYPDGAASMADENVFINFGGLPTFEAIYMAASGYGERVERADYLPAALERAESGSG